MGIYWFLLSMLDQCYVFKGLYDVDSHVICFVYVDKPKKSWQSNSGLDNIN